MAKTEEEVVVPSWVDDLEDDAMDELVHDAVSHDATAINNSGKDEQYRYLVSCGYSEQELKDMLGV